MAAPFLVFLFIVAICTSPSLAGRKESVGNTVIAKYDEDNHLQQKKLDPMVEVSEKYEYYDIDGANAVELRRQMSRNGTKWDDGKTYDALTTWNIRYNYDTKKENGTCYLEGVKTDVAIVYRLPRWPGAATAPEELSGRWNTYMDSLKEHEFGHKELAVKAATEISEGLAAMGNFNSCSDLDKAAKKLARAKLALMKQVQIDYDAETGHGRSQGAVFP